MALTTLRPPHKTLVLGHKRYEDGDTVPAWDLYLDDALVASGYTSQTEALIELDLIAWYALFGDAPLSPSVEISDAALELALTVFTELFTNEKVREKAHTAVESILRAQIYAILPDGSLSVTASSGRGRKGAKAAYTISAYRSAPDAYQVTMTCECPDFWTRARNHGGICKHVAARLLLFLAQQGVSVLHAFAASFAQPTPPALVQSTPPALVQSAPATLVHPTSPTLVQSAPPAPTPPTLVTPPVAAPRPALAHPDDLDDTLAFVELPADELAAALFLALRAAAPILVRAVAGDMQLKAGKRSLLLPGRDGGGCAALTFSTDALSSLAEQLRPFASSLALFQVFLDLSSHTLTLCGLDCSLSVQIAATPLEAPSALSRVR